jgi:hypothetical protein
MVLMNASKMARNAASIINLPNCGGTAKKGGLAPSIGPYGSNLPLRGATQTQFGLLCIGNFTNPSQSALRAIRRY